MIIHFLRHVYIAGDSIWGVEVESALRRYQPEVTGVNSGAAQFLSGGPKEGVKMTETVRHVVIFKYKPEATKAQIEQVTEAFRALKGMIPGILAFEHGVNNSPEGKNLGFTHVYLLTFEDTQARDTYLPHPEHRKFGEFLEQLDILEDVFVVDYVPSDSY
jgi:Stress responsive A/B Barrel Domain